MKIENNDLLLFDDWHIDKLIELYKDMLWKYKCEDAPPTSNCKRFRQAQIRFFEAILRELVKEKHRRHLEYERLGEEFANPPENSY